MINFPCELIYRLRLDNIPDSPSQSTTVSASRRTYSPFSDDDRIAAGSSRQTVDRRASLVQQWLEQRANARLGHDAKLIQRATDPGPSSYTYRTAHGAHAPTYESSEQEDHGILGSFVLVSEDEADIPMHERLEDGNSEVWAARDRPSSVTEHSYASFLSLVAPSFAHEAAWLAPALGPFQTVICFP